MWCSWHFQNNQNNKERGFTLIELMIVVAIIGILASIAVPAYQDYIARSQATEGAVLLAGLKSPVSERWRTNSVLPSLSDIAFGASVKTSGTYVASVTDGAGGPGSGQYQANFRGPGAVSRQLISKTIVMTFVTATNDFIFSCVSIPTSIQPRVCP